jgi:fructoselysine-6-P-deglycase FrlB-like protein
MFDVKTMVSEIISQKEIKNVSFSGCGGSLACFYAPYYYINKESEVITSNYTTANEFVHDIPKNVGPNSIVVVASRRGNTAETVESARKAKKLGATVVGLAYEKDTVMEGIVDYIIHFDDALGVPFEVSKGAYALKIAYEVVHQVEGKGCYDAMVNAMAKMNEIVPKAKEAIIPEAIKFSIDYKDDNVIYTMGSGTAWAAAQQQTICIFMEMQWINSSVIHTGEFFHGPLEITDPDTAYLLLKSTGNTKPLDERTITFLSQYNSHLHIIDGEKYGLCELGEVNGYYDALFYSEMLDVYNNLLADMRNHPLSKRKYMWKYNY